MKKKLTATILVLALAIGFQITVSPSASAGQLSTGGVSVTWDDSTLIKPTACSRIIFNFSADSTVNYGLLTFYTSTGVQFGQGMTDPSNPGIATVQVCNGADFSGATLKLNVIKKYNYATGEVFAVSTPVTFLGNTTSSTTSTTTLTTAEQLSAFMAAVTNLQIQMNKLQKQLDTANAKLSKVCRVKPKPKYC
jgi:TolA-binding protein